MRDSSDRPPPRNGPRGTLRNERRNSAPRGPQECLWQGPAAADGAGLCESGRAGNRTSDRPAPKTGLTEPVSRAEMLSSIRRKVLSPRQIRNQILTSTEYGAVMSASSSRACGARDRKSGDICRLSQPPSMTSFMDLARNGASRIARLSRRAISFASAKNGEFPEVLPVPSQDRRIETDADAPREYRRRFRVPLRATASLPIKPWSCSPERAGAAPR